MSEFEKLKQYIIESVNSHFIFLLKQYKNECNANQDIIDTLEKSKINFYTERLSGNAGQKAYFKNKEIDKLTAKYEQLKNDKKKEIKELKEVYKHLLKDKHNYFNRLKIELEKSAKKNTVLKEILYNEDNVFTEWILNQLLCLLLGISSSHEAKQRLNLLLEEYAPYFMKIKAPKEEEITRAMLTDSIIEILMQNFINDEFYYFSLLEYLFKKDTLGIEQKIEQLITYMKKNKSEKSIINYIEELLTRYKNQKERTVTRLIDDISKLLIVDILREKTPHRIRTYTVKTHPHQLK
ncbi:MAG: hypothetical protein M0Q25_00225 [Sulfurospirillaceae bacterium]|nr:hypothetical protein [Sulfurospirillaceae bacterium]